MNLFIKFALLTDLEEIEKQQSADSSEFLNAFSSVMVPELLRRLRLYGWRAAKSSLERKVGDSGPVLILLDIKMEKQRKTIQQDVAANIIAQLQRAGLIMWTYW